MPLGIRWGFVVLSLSKRAGDCLILYKYYFSPQKPHGDKQNKLKRQAIFLCVKKVFVCYCID